MEGPTQIDLVVEDAPPVSEIYLEMVGLTPETDIGQMVARFSTGRPGPSQQWFGLHHGSLLFKEHSVRTEQLPPEIFPIVGTHR